MTQFVDNMNQTWQIDLDAGKVRRLKQQLGLDLMNPNDFLQVAGSLTERIAFVFLLCEEQAKEYQVPASEFEERLYGDGFSNAASDALLAEVENFSRKLGQDGLALLAKNSRESMAAGQAVLAEMITDGHLDSMLTKASSQITQQLREAVGNGSTN